MTRQAGFFFAGVKRGLRGFGGSPECHFVGKLFNWAPDKGFRFTGGDAFEDEKRSGREPKDPRW